jgi:ADP-ribose pyrophosphatase
VKWTEPESPAGWATKERITRYSDDHLAVVTESVISPAGKKPKSWTTIYRKQAVVIAAMTRDKCLVLVRQERIPIREAIWEMPAGQVDEDDPGIEEVEATALRELQEETGYVLADDGKIINLGDCLSSPGFTDEREHLFLLSPVEEKEPKNREESIIDCRAFTVNEIRDMIARNEIRDANTLSMFARLVARGLIHFDPPTE